MDRIIWLVGAVVIVLFILGYFWVQVEGTKFALQKASESIDKDIKPGDMAGNRLISCWSHQRHSSSPLPIGVHCLGLVSHFLLG